MQSWISVCEGSKGGGREASSRSRQHYTQVPEGVAPTQLSTPITMAWLCPGHPCLTASLYFSHGSFLSHTGRSRAVLLSMEEASFSYPCHTYSHTESERERVHSFLPTCSLFSSLFSFSPFFLVFAHCSPSANPQKPNSATKNPLLQMPVAIEQLFSPALSQTHSSLPLFCSSFVHLQLCCPLSYSKNR